MLPVLVDFGPFALHTYGLLVAGGFAAALLYCLRQANREGLDGDAFANLFFVVVVSAIAGSRLLFVLFNYRYFLDHPLRVFAIWEGGLVFHGGLLLAIACSYWFMRRSRLPVWQSADIAAPAIALGQAIGRLGCLAAGCCFGREADIPWAVTFTHPECLAPRYTPLHPTQIYSAVAHAVIFLALHLYRPRRSAYGQVFWLYLVLASSARLVEDAFRGEAAKLSILPALSAVQAIALVIIPVALFFFVRFGVKSTSFHGNRDA